MKAETDSIRASLDVQFDRTRNHLTVYLAGELDPTTAPGLADQLIARVDGSTAELWLDLSAVSYCDSSGLAAFVRLHHHIDGHGGRLLLYAPQPTVSKVLDITGIDTVIPVVGHRDPRS